MSRDPHTSMARRRLLVFATALALLTVLSVAWTLVPREWIDPDAILVALGELGRQPGAPWIALAAFLVGGLMVLPVTPIVVATIVAFGSLEGFCYALTGVTLSALAGFGIGRVAGHRQMQWLTGSRVYRLSTTVGDAGIVSVAAARMLPVTHFTVVSLIAGTSHIRPRDFVAGTVIGMAPGIAGIALLFDRFSALTREPTPLQWLAFVAVSAGILGLLLLGRRFARRR